MRPYSAFATALVSLIRTQLLSLYLLIVYGGTMKALRVGVCLLVAFSGARAFASEPAADAGPLPGITGRLAPEHQRSRPSTSPPMSLAELETVALADNPENPGGDASRRNRLETGAQCWVVERPRVHVSRLGHTTRQALGPEPDAAHVHVQSVTARSGQASTSHTTCFGGSGACQSGTGGEEARCDISSPKDVL